MTDQPVNVGSFPKAIVALADALALVDDADWFDRQSPQVRNTLVAGTIQSVEFVFELGVRTLKRAMEARAASPAQLDHLNFRDMIRTAAEMGLIDDVSAWFAYREMRNITAHTYDAGKAAVVLRRAPDFLAHARDLLDRIEARNG